MASAMAPYSGFELIFDAALIEYARQTGINLATYPPAEKLMNCGSPDAVIQLLQEKMQGFKVFRDRGSKLIKWLRPLVQVIYLVSGVLGHTTDPVMMNPARAIFVSIHVLLSAASRVSASYDALVDIFECVGNFLNRVQIYVKIPLTQPMMDVMVEIMVELLSVLALATTQIKQGRLKKFIKKLFGHRDCKIEAVLRRLDRLTQEEVRMATVQTLELVHGLVENVGVIMDDGKISADYMRQVLVMLQGTADAEEINKMKRDRLQENIRNWLFPPDPSKNHNAARNHHSGTATQGHIFKQWKKTGSLLWIHGKPAIIQKVKALPDAGSIIMAYFKCDFQDSEKQDVHEVLTSLLAQLCAESDTFSQILFDLYVKHDAGSQQPNDDTLVQWLRLMLQFPGQPPVYLVLDAIDEYPNITGIVSARDRVLELIEKLVGLHLPNLHICLTSRPEADIQASLSSLAPHTISLHKESGRKMDKVNCIRSVLQSDQNIRKRRAGNKQPKRAEGMFRWVICQSEVLRRSIPATIRRALDDLPRSLDETPKRVLLEIAAEKRNHAHGLFQCLTVSVRPLRVQEFAGIIVSQSGGPLPTNNAHWLPEKPEEAAPSTCSSLVAVVDVDGSSVARFSHFSVKEFLTSERLPNAGGNLSGLYILPQSAHTTFAKAYLGVMLDNHSDKNSMETSSLAIYAARHWVYHSQIEEIHDIGTLFWEPMSATKSAIPLIRPEAAPLYYAILCDFRDLIKCLVLTPPTLFNARGYYHATPLHTAVTTGKVDIMRLLLNNGAEVNTLDDQGWGPRHGASRSGDLDVLKLLLEHQADADILGYDKETLLFLASRDGIVKIARILLRDGAVVDARRKHSWTSLTAGSRLGHMGVVRLLIQNGAVVDSQGDKCWTPLRLASRYGHLDVVQELVGCGASINPQKHDLRTVLHLAPDVGNVKVARLLIKRGADVNSRDNNNWTQLHTASWNGRLDVVRLLPESPTNIGIQIENLRTPLALASHNGQVISRSLIRRGADVNSSDGAGWTPSHWAARYGHLDIVRLLLDNGAAVGVQRETPLADEDLNIANWLSLLIHSDADVDKAYTNQCAQLCRASGCRPLEIARLIVHHGSNTNSKEVMGCTPLHVAAQNGRLDVVKLLLERGVDVNTRNLDNMTSSDLASKNGKLVVARFLAERMGGVLNTLDGADADPTLQKRRYDITQPSFSRSHDRTYSDGEPEAIASSNIAPQLEDHDVLHSSREGRLERATLLIERGADSDVNGRDKAGWAPLPKASRFGLFRVPKLLREHEHDADVSAKRRPQWTLPHPASYHGHLYVVKLLLKWGGTARARSEARRRPAQGALRAGAGGESGISRSCRRGMARVECRVPSGRDIL